MIATQFLSPHSLAIHHKPKRIQNYIYDTQTLLGKGCFSAVHPGHHIATNSKVAIKIVKLSSIVNNKMKELLDQETQIICSLNHTNIIQCYQVLKSDNHCYFITEICEQGSLQKKLSSKKILNQDEARPIVQGIYQGLRYLEMKGIVHRDLKPANIFIKEGVAKIADFGFAVRTRNQFKDIKIGSPLYMPPQSLGQSLYSHKSDVWAFGVLIYQLLHGKTPLSNCRSERDLSLSISKQIEQNDLRSDLSIQMKQLILKCLRVHQQDRISIRQMENMAYFKNTNKQRLVRRQHTIQRSLSPSYQLQQRSTNRVLTDFRSPNHHNSHLFKNELLICTKDNNSDYQKEREMQSNTDSTISTIGQSCLLRGKIHFQECIGLIHFCRLTFRLIENKPIPRLPLAEIKGLASKILQDLQAKLKSNQILFTVIELEQGRKTKLKQVIYEYQQKYQLNSCCRFPDLSNIISSQHIEMHSPHMLKQRSQLHLFLQYCNKLQSSINQFDYSVFSHGVGPLQSCLARLSKSP